MVRNTCMALSIQDTKEKEHPIITECVYSCDCAHQPEYRMKENSTYAKCSYT